MCRCKLTPVELLFEFKSKNTEPLFVKKTVENWILTVFDRFFFKKVVKCYFYILSPDLKSSRYLRPI